MTVRGSWLVCWLVCLGFQVVACPDDDGEPLAQPPGGEQRPVGYYDPLVVQQPAATRSDLSLAAEQLEQGNAAAACDHLGKYLQSHPLHDEVRWHYAELLARLERRSEARREYLRFLAQAQERGEATAPERIQCHLRLMRMAEADDDESGRRLHRGVGLYLLAVQRAKLGDNDGELPVEGLLCRAAGELTGAYLHGPQAAQPCWYLYKVWSALGQGATARRWLARATALAPFTDMTPAEQRGLALAIRWQQGAPARP